MRLIGTVLLYAGGVIATLYAGTLPDPSMLPSTHQPSFPTSPVLRLLLLITVEVALLSAAFLPRYTQNYYGPFIAFVISLAFTSWATSHITMQSPPYEVAYLVWTVLAWACCLGLVVRAWASPNNRWSGRDR